MLFLTAATIGLCAGLLRSAAGIAVIAVMIVAAFIAAALISSASALDLMVAIIGYNLGLAQVVAGALVLQARRA